MYAPMFVCLYLFVIFYCAFGEENEEDKTKLYTATTFREAINKNDHFVMFYAPWCSHCERLKPVWKDLAAMLNEGIEHQVTVAKVDCTVETPLCSEHDVTGYPTLKYFHANTKEGVKFKGIRDLPTLSAFINELRERKTGGAEDDVKIVLPEPVSGLVELTDETFEKHVASGQHFVKFYAPWCGHCQKLAPVWDELAKSFAHDTSAIIAKVDCTLQRNACNTFEIKSYPTLLWIEDGKKVEKYQGPRTHEDLKAFVNTILKSSASEPQTKPDEVAETGSQVLFLSGDNFHNTIQNGISFVKFFAPWCGHCKRLAPTWDELGKKFGSDPNVKIVKVDCTQDASKELCDELEVDGFPSLYLYRDGEKISEYDGTRSLDDLYSFVISQTAHDEL